MGTMKAVITNPLEKTEKYKAATAVTQQAKEGLATTRRQARADGTVTAAERDKINQGKAGVRTARRNQKSIKGKFKDKRANVVEFDTQWMWDKVKEILSPEHPLNQAWDLMHQSNQQLNTLLDGTNQIAEGAANNQALLQQDAMRMSLLLGAPLPDKAADHVLIGSNRGEVDPRDRGRRSLRIDQTPTPSLAI